MSVNALCTCDYICVQGVCYLVISLLLCFEGLVHCTWYLLF